MKNNSWSKTYSPPRGGWNRLSTKMTARDADRRKELQLWAAAASVLIVVTALVAEFSHRSEIDFKIRYPEMPVITGGTAAPVPSETPGVRMFWILRD